MLTDYHVHLRPDDVDATPAERYLTAANAERYREAAAERGIEELGVAEHVYRFTQALEVWQHELWRHSARDDLDAYCAFVREETDLKLGIEADFIPGREDRMAELLAGRDFDYVVGSIHFVGDGALDYDNLRHLVGGELAREGVADVLRVAGAGRGERDVRHPRPPRPRQVLGPAQRPWPERRPALLLRDRHGGRSPSRASRSRSPRPGCASRSASCIRRAPSWRWCSTPATRSRSPATPTRPRTSAATTTRRWSCSRSSGSTELAVFERRERRLEPIG